jgi:hypothetical protein
MIAAAAGLSPHPLSRARQQPRPTFPFCFRLGLDYGAHPLGSSMGVHPRSYSSARVPAIREEARRARGEAPRHEKR